MLRRCVQRSWREGWSGMGWRRRCWREMSTDAPLPRYEAMAAAGELTTDVHQIEVATELTRVHHDMVPWVKKRREGSVWGRKDRPRGCYVYGGVGTGKTMLMDMLRDSCESEGVRVERSHFNSFMLQIHSDLHELRGSATEDPLSVVADGLSRRLDLLCFDEFQVTDVGDAMVMMRLFSALWDRGVVLVATSNRPVMDLYKNGLQRAAFEPFLHRLSRECVVLRCGTTVDFRLMGERAGHTWTVAGSEDGGDLDDVWESVTKTAQTSPDPVMLHLPGRFLVCPKAVEDVAAWFDFAELCEKPLGAADYIVLAQHFPVLCLDKVPHLSLTNANALRRFITLVDTLYEHRTKLFVRAAAPMELLFQADGDKREENEEAFAWDRCMSRLIEMASKEYLGSQWLQFDNTEKK